MKRAVVRITALALVLFLVLGASCAAADGGEWTCTDCGQAGNTGNFCSNCGAARPSADWTCTTCGQTGNTGNFCSNCGAGKQDGSAAPAPVQAVNQSLEQIPGETDRVKICLESVEASSYISNKQDPSRWLPANATDGRESTCWQFSAKKGLKGKSWIRLNTGEPQTVNEIWFKNGFWAVNDKGIGQYEINARLKVIRLEFLYSGETKFRDAAEYTLRDEAFGDWQRIQLSAHENVVAVKIGVISTYKGSHYKNDVCLSEVMLVRYAPAATAKAPQAEQAAVVYESRPDVTGVGLKNKLATRSGPGTQYDEPGTFFGSNWQGQTVRVLGKQWDGSTWWVLVDFKYGSMGSFRVWTGLKRVDVDLNKVKEINGIGQGTVNSTSRTYRGPGGNYAKAKVTINGWKDVVAYGRENGYVEVEFKQGAKWYRLWVPESETSIDWGTDNSGEN